MRIKEYGLVCLLVLLIQACAGVSPTATRRQGIRPRRSTGKAAPTQRPYTIAGETYYPLATERGFVQEGIASWYGEDFHGRLTANGEVYDMYGESAAHKTLPMHTYVRVTNLRNQRQMLVRINDRGPFVKGRILDLSYGAAQKLGVVQTGTAPVKIEALGRKVKARGGKQAYFVPMDFSRGNFTLQVGAFMEKNNALSLVERLSTRYANAHWVIFDSSRGRFYRVRVGKYDTLVRAEAARREFAQIGFPDAFVVAE